MSYKVRDKGDQEFIPAPAGTHLATCCSVIYAGLQSSPFGTQPKLILQFELANETDQAGNRHIVSAFYTASLHKKAKLRGVLEAWRSRPFTNDELNGFEVEKLLGVPCLVTLGHKQKADGGTVAAISAITSVPKGTGRPELKRKPLYYSVDEPNATAYESLPEWLQKICDAAEKQEPEPVPQSAQKADEFVEEIPF